MITPSWRYGCHQKNMNMVKPSGGVGTNPTNGTIGSLLSSTAVGRRRIYFWERRCMPFGGGADGVNDTTLIILPLQLLSSTTSTVG